MNLRAFSIAAGIVAALAYSAAPLRAAGPGSFTGEILGEVKNGAGIAQMGASVLLYNKYDELVRQSLTSSEGRFAFDSLTPDIYTIKVILASFVPAERRHIAVAANSENRLQINLNSVLSTVELAPPTGSRGTLMTDDWKWVLRSSQSTRPVLRMLPDDGRRPASRTSETALFTNTTGVLKVSAGEGSSFARGTQQDLGTAFAIATSLAGEGRVQLSGNVGYGGPSGMPASGFRTSYSRPTEYGSSPEVVVTMQQMYLSPRGSINTAPGAGTGIAMGSDNAPVLRTMSVAFMDSMKLGDQLKLDYGFDFQSISYIDRLNYASPYLRASYDAGPQGVVRVAYSSGAPPLELAGRSSENSTSFDRDLAALAFMPRLSRSSGRVALERTQNVEIGYERVVGSRTFSASAYQESVSNAAFMVSGPTGTLFPDIDLLPDLGSGSSILNVGSFRRTGYTVAMTQNLGDDVEVSVTAGRTGALLAPTSQGSFSDAGEMRAGIQQGNRAWVTVRASGRVPVTGTRISANYGWTDFRVLMPLHLFVTQPTYQDIGLNLYVHQPLPAMFGLPMRMELTGELRNILAQGYLPLGGTGSSTVLTNSPKAVRGGLSFIF